MRAELEKIVGAPALDEREVRDHWPLGIMEERDGVKRPKVLVARPAGREQVIAILRWAGDNGVAVTPMGGGTGVCGALAPRAGEIVLDMSAFDRILDLDETNLVCRCESGVNGLVLEKHLNERGLTLGHFPSSLPGTTVGGLLATRSSGQESSRYGNVEDMVLGLAVVLADGTFATPRPGPRSAVGPALHQLWLGSEGALGVILGAELRVHRLPEKVVGKGYGFKDVASGLEAMRAVMQSGIRPLVLRLYDPEDTAFSGHDLPAGGCLLVVATAGQADVAKTEALGEPPIQPFCRASQGVPRPARRLPRHNRACGAMDGSSRASYKGKVRNSHRWIGVMPFQSRLRAGLLRVLLVWRIRRHRG